MEDEHGSVTESEAQVMINGGDLQKSLDDLTGKLRVVANTSVEGSVSFIPDLLLLTSQIESLSGIISF